VRWNGFRRVDACALPPASQSRTPDFMNLPQNNADL